MKGVLYATGSAISQGLMFVLIIISIKETIAYYRSKGLKTKAVKDYFKSVNYLLLLYTVYGIVLFMTDGFVNKVGPTYSFLQAPYITFFPIYTCYVYSKKGYLTSNNLKIWVLAFLVVGISQYFYTEFMTVERILDKGGDADQLTNNAGYILLALIPAMLVFRNKIVYMFLGIGVCVFFILMSMKRGAIMITAMAIILIIFNQMKHTTHSKKINYILVVIVCMLVLFNFVQNMIESNEYFSIRIQETLEGDSSERDVLYKNIWGIYINDFNIVEKIFGVGGMGTVKATGMYAHNDWLEIIFDQGIIGVFLFFYFWLNFYKTTRKKQFSGTSRFCLFLIVAIFGIKTLFSMSIGGMSIFATSVLGFALADGFANEKSFKHIAA